MAKFQVPVEKSHSELFWSAFFPHFTAFELNKERYGVSCT